MPIQDLKGHIARLPEQPGVYLYYNDDNETLYVGKARVLRDRVRSYLGAYGMSTRIDALLDEASRLEVIVTDSVVASLARKTMSLSHKLFGIRSCNETITGQRARPCLEFDIKRCAAPCVHELCSESEYRVAVEHTQLFLEGRNDELVTTLRERMTEAAGAERFEQAAQLRDALKTVETLRTRQQKMAGPEFGDRDAFGVKIGPAGAV